MASFLLSVRSLFAGSLFALAGLVSLPTAGRAAAAESGVVSGDVFDARTKQALSGARVALAGTELLATTGLDGRFRIAAVPAGSHTLRVTYLGADAVERRVDVPAGGLREVSLGVSIGFVKLEALIVSSFAGPRLQALNEQRQGDRFPSIVSADSVDNMPDPDMRSALSRLPGMSVTGETGVVSTRGVEGKLNAVLMDGGSISQAAVRLDGNGDTARTRATDLQAVPSESAQSIEVIKTLTPDLDATAFGGVVNIRTGSAFGSRQRILAFTPSYLRWDQKVSGEQFQFFFRDQLNAARTLGAMFNASYKHFGRVYSRNEYHYVNGSHLTDVQVRNRLGEPTFLANGQPQYAVITRRENGGRQELRGYEISWQHRFNRLPSPFDGLGAGVNYSNVCGTQDRQLYTERTAPFRITGFVRDPRTQDQPRQVLSSQLFWEKYSFQVRGSYSWQDEQVAAFDQVGLSDRLHAPLKFVDASLGYNFRNGWKVQLSVRNLTEEWEDYRYWQQRRFVRNYDEDGRS